MKTGGDALQKLLGRTKNQLMKTKVISLVKLVLTHDTFLVFNGECIKDGHYPILQYHHRKYSNLHYREMQRHEFAQLTPQGLDY